MKRPVKRTGRVCLHEGIGGMAYSAFRERWTEVDRKAARVLEFVRA